MASMVNPGDCEGCSGFKAFRYQQADGRWLCRGCIVQPWEARVTANLLAAGCDDPETCAGACLANKQ
jgi:hypothetical protein